MGKTLTSKLYLGNPRRIWHWCPACKCLHRYDLAVPLHQPEWEGINEESSPSQHQWSFNGNLEAPTFMPSMLIFTSHPDRSRPWEEWVAMKERGEITEIPYTRTTVCHYHIIDGNIHYCEDCPHELRGKIVPLPDLPNPNYYGYPRS